MFYQQDVYVPTEYGTNECKQDREPCGAFYGLPCSGEVDGVSEYERQQILDAMPCRWFSERDEQVLASLRGDRKQKMIVPSKPENDSKQAVKRWNEQRIEALVTEFAEETKASENVVNEYRAIARAYVYGNNKLLNDLINKYQTWENIRNRNGRS